MPETQQMQIAELAKSLETLADLLRRPDIAELLKRARPPEGDQAAAAICDQCCLVGGGQVGKAMVEAA